MTKLCLEDDVTLLAGGSRNLHRGRARSAFYLAVLVAASATVWGRPSAVPPRVIILGFDGFDFSLTRDLMAQGRMPNFSRVAARGGFGPLGSSIPPQSPVAWTTFMTGQDPGVHGIFDFVQRDPKTMEPYMSTTRAAPRAAQALNLGGWKIPSWFPRIGSLRRGAPFWEALEDRGTETTIIRMPANFPPSGTATRELSGMGTPDILGTYGRFSFFTSAPGPARANVSGGTVLHITSSGGVVKGAIDGPDQPSLARPEPVRTAFVAYIDPSRRRARIVVGAEERVLNVGQWSDWVPVVFDGAARTQAECRLYLKQIDPTFELYISPANMDPLAPMLPISTPAAYAAELARATGRFYTQGMPEETNALNDGLISTDEFLQQARETQDENHRQFRYVLAHFDRGLLFYYFGNVDQVSHMLWGARDTKRPGYNAARDTRYARVIDELYVAFDGIVGEALQRLAPEDLLVVMSDHGFASWRRSFNLNTWLRDQGYLTAADRPGDAVLGQIDLSRTRAYGLGLNGLYVNMKGREASGLVDPAARTALLNEISAKLLATIDPATDQPAVAKIFRREQIYSQGGQDDASPDLIIGYAKGTRVSGESALGGLSSAVFAENTGAWSGDHVMDPETVPGIVLTNRVLKQRASTLQTLAPAILAELGVAFQRP